MGMEPEDPKFRLQSGANLTKTLDEVKNIVRDVNRHKAERQEINAEIQSLREKATTLGIPKAALDMAMRYMDWEPEKREGFDLAYQLVREACGLPVQGDLFANAEQRGREKAAQAKSDDVKATADAAFADTAEKRDARKANEDAEQSEGEKVLDRAPPKAPKASKDNGARNATGIDDER